jgi:hypothetical protein
MTTAKERNQCEDDQPADFAGFLLDKPEVGAMVSGHSLSIDKNRSNAISHSTFY